MNDNKLKNNQEIQIDDFTGLDDGLAGSSEDAYDGDYTIQQAKINGKTVNKRVGTFTPKTEEEKAEDGHLPSLDEKLAAAEKKFEEQFRTQDKSKSKNKDDLTH